MQTPIEMLCRGFPPEFATYMSYCRSLRFEDRPDYSYLKRMIKDLFFRENYQWDFVFDWTLINSQSRREGEEEKKASEPVRKEEEDAPVARARPRA